MRVEQTVQPAFLRHPIPPERIHHTPTDDDVAEHRRSASAGKPRVARIVRPQDVEQELMTAARGAHSADERFVAAEFSGMRFEPANAEVDLGDRVGIARLRRHPKIQGRDDDAFRSEVLVDRRVLGPVIGCPNAAVHVDDGRKRSRPIGLIDAG